MDLTVIAVGKLKERWLKDGCDEYLKRMGAWSSARVVEVEEYRLPENPSPAQIAQGLKKEGESILAAIPKGARTVSLCIEGKLVSSQELADYLARSAVQGQGGFAFVIGGSFGLDEQVKSISHLRLSISPMTFPHQLARLMLLEQLYRALSICAGGKYHK